MPSTQTWLDSATLQKAIELMNKAIDTAKTETYKKRLLREKLSIDLVLLKERYYSLRRSAEFSGQKFCTFIDPQTFINDFFARCHEFNLHHLTTSIVEDSGAFKNSNSRAAMIHGNSSMWLNYSFDNTLNFLKPYKPENISETPLYHIYGAVRCTAKVDNGKAFSYGIYDLETKKYLLRSYVDISKIKGTDYYWVDFGAIALRPHHNIYFVPAEQAQVNEIYVDRIFLIRTNSQEPPCIHGEYQPKTWILEKIAEGRLIRNSGFRFRIKQSGKETFSISDNCASDRRTVMMPSELNCRSIRIPLKKYLTAIPSSADSSSKYKIFASVCCAVQSTVGPALSFGVFDSVTNKDIIIKTVPVVQVGNHPWGNQSYSWVELDPIALKPQNDVWFAPPGKKGNVMNIYVDKIVLVHCKTKN